jgi:hypothetical protein
MKIYYKIIFNKEDSGVYTANVERFPPYIVGQKLQYKENYNMGSPIGGLYKIEEIIHHFTYYPKTDDGSDAFNEFSMELILKKD